MLFKRFFFLACCLLSAAACFVFFLHVRVRSDNIALYKKLTQERQKQRSLRALEQYPTCQVRDNVQKDIWADNGQTRRHVRLLSAHSKLFLKQKKDKIEAIEALDNITCLIEEGASVQTLKAASGSYTYPSHRFLARDVHIEEAGRFSVRSDTAELTFQSKKELTMSGNVRLFSPCIQNKESFSLADKLLVQLDTQTLLLSAEPPHRVLFWQDGLSLSAPVVLIQRDPLTKSESIHGKGDTHFTFNLEEQNIIDQLISKYL